MYKNNFVVAVKCNGEVLREIGDVTTLPFGSEYSILLKNLDSRKALVRVSVDGKDVLDGSGLIIAGNCETELKGVLKGDDIRNKFKYIQKTKEIAEYRGDRLDDGYIRVEYHFEKVINSSITTNTTYLNHVNRCICQKCFCCPCVCNSSGTYTPSWTFTCGDSNSNMYIDGDGSCGSVCLDSNVNAYNCSLDKCCTPNQDEGITVTGSEVNQKFYNGRIGQTEETSTVIILKLRGTNESGKKVEKPKTVSSVITCPTCGKRSRSNCKYCSKCGTYLL